MQLSEEIKEERDAESQAGKIGEYIRKGNDYR
jgi:hypothetical protein